ncbi:RDD family protein [Streptomyces sp. CB03238]|uniref:RDD family protein n=1 Tax=Streptomyces sp. CB03238 TaxID=1907777 RepID=UPI0015C48ED1|nr:RDD family protein [Streptomyces sp. CB03238]
MEDSQGRFREHGPAGTTHEELLRQQRLLATQLRSAAGTPAGPWLRLLALVIDVVAWLGATAVPILLTGGIAKLFGFDAGESGSGPPALAIPGVLITMVIFWGYVPICTRLWGATPGKLALRLRVINYTTGEPVTPARSWGRFLLHALFAVTCWGILLLIDHLWVFGEEGRTLHDKASGTTVVRI